LPRRYGDDDQFDVYPRRGVESGLTRAQIVEALTRRRLLVSEEGSCR
jgi:hypothetical protein